MADGRFERYGSPVEGGHLSAGKGSRCCTCHSSFGASHGISASMDGDHRKSWSKN